MTYRISAVRLALLTMLFIFPLAGQAQQTIRLACEYEYSTSVREGESGPTTGSLFFSVTPVEGRTVKISLGGESRGEILGQMTEEMITGTGYKEGSGVKSSDEFTINRFTGELEHRWNVNGDLIRIFTGKCRPLQNKLF